MATREKLIQTARGRQVVDLIEMVHNARVDSDIDPFITLSFLSLPVVPEIRVADMGVFDVGNLKFI